MRNPGDQKTLFPPLPLTSPPLPPPLQNNLAVVFLTRHASPRWVPWASYPEVVEGHGSTWEHKHRSMNSSRVVAICMARVHMLLKKENGNPHSYYFPVSS